MRMFTASAVNGITSGNTSTKALASSTRWRRASSSQLFGAVLDGTMTRVTSLISAHQSGAAEETLRPDQEHERHQREDRDLGHFRCEQRGHADDDSDQEPRENRASDRTPV